MARKITDTEIEEMFVAWQEKPTLRYVARKCSVCVPTVRRYRDLGGWAERDKKIKVKAQRKADTGISTLRAKQLVAGTKMREVGLKKLNGMSGKDIKKIKVRDAKDLIKDGIGIEREAVGDVAPDTVVVLALPVGLEDM